jgi:hypothetical protein
MKRFHTGLIVLDKLDIICISFSAGSSVAFLIRKYKSYKRRGSEDPIVVELKQKSSVIMVSENGKPLKLPLIRGGENLEGLSLLIKNKKFAILVRAIVNAIKRRKQLRLLRLSFVALNALLTTSIGIRLGIGGSLDYTHFILIAFPSTVGGLIMGLTTANPLASVLLPLAILYSRGIENVPDPLDKCRAICKVAEEFHNKELTMQMKKLNSLVKETSSENDRLPLLCVEQKLSLSKRYKLKALIESKKVQERVQYFSEFIKKFPECDVDPKAVYEELVGKSPE